MGPAPRAEVARRAAVPGRHPQGVPLVVAPHRRPRAVPHGAFGRRPDRRCLRHDEAAIGGRRNSQITQLIPCRSRLLSLGNPPRRILFPVRPGSDCATRILQFYGKGQGGLVARGDFSVVLSLFLRRRKTRKIGVSVQKLFRLRELDTWVNEKNGSRATDRTRARTFRDAQR